mmetsp:Transcript_18381/g.47073  ORF Transcript_18381/g.47073 Transcript_18381/m.47073 type:complete len:221 (-) Transcript_18381:18-680(-)
MHAYCRSRMRISSIQKSGWVCYGAWLILWAWKHASQTSRFAAPSLWPTIPIFTASMRLKAALCRQQLMTLTQITPQCASCGSSFEGKPVRLDIILTGMWLVEETALPRTLLQDHQHAHYCDQRCRLRLHLCALRVHATQSAMLLLYPCLCEGQLKGDALASSRTGGRPLGGGGLSTSHLHRISPAPVVGSSTISDISYRDSSYLNTTRQTTRKYHTVLCI